ncbi:PSK operon transcription factor [bacterium]|nr:MAG: PSK operon transcription factor [bacterium]
MALSIKDPEADRLACVRARRTPSLRTEIERIARWVSRRRVRDARSADEILGYEERGLPR